MNKLNEDDDYRESEDEDYNPELEVNDSSDSEEYENQEIKEPEEVKPTVDVDSVWAEMLSTSTSKPVKPKEETIEITRTFKFAGETKTETKIVPKFSSEGQDFLKQQELKSQKRPVKRKMSMLEEYQMNKTKKINTLEKSRLDWLGFVDKEGIKEDLVKHNKDGYIDKQSFLERVDMKRESEIRRERAKDMNKTHRT